MSDGRTLSLALIIQNPPYRNRVARADVDFALAAAALDFKVTVCFTGPAAMQLVSRKDPSDAGLPAGYRAWAALPDLAETRFYIEKKWHDHFQAHGLDLKVLAEPLCPEDMRRTWRGCDHVLVL